MIKNVAANILTLLAKKNISQLRQKKLTNLNEDLR